MADRVLVALFSHTGDGDKALAELLEAGIVQDAFQVVGDLGAPAGQTGALQHVTFDALHIPHGQRAQFMDGIRSGGVVLAVGGVDASAWVEETLVKHGAVVVERMEGAGENASHNVA